MKTIVIRPVQPGRPMVVGVPDFSRALGWQALLKVGAVVLKLVDDQNQGNLDLTTAEVVEGGDLQGRQLRFGDKVSFLRDGPFPQARGAVYQLLLQAA